MIHLVLKIPFQAFAVGIQIFEQLIHIPGQEIFKKLPKPFGQGR